MVLFLFHLFSLLFYRLKKRLLCFHLIFHKNASNHHSHKASKPGRHCSEPSSLNFHLCPKDFPSRMEKLAYYLQNTDLPLTEILDKIGIPEKSVSHSNRHFIRKLSLIKAVSRLRSVSAASGADTAHFIICTEHRIR